MTAVEWFRRRPTRLVVAAVMVVTSLLMYDYARASSTDRAAPRFSGAELTQGVVFMEGPAAPYIWGSQLLADLAPQLAIPVPHEDVLFSLLTRDKDVTSAFAADLQSGRPLRVARAFRGLGVRLQNALKDIHGAETMSALRRAGDELVAQTRRLVGRPDFASGKAMRDFSDAAPSGGWSGDEAARPRVPDVISQNLLLFFRSANIFYDNSVFLQFTTAVQYQVLAVLGVALAAIIFFFIIIFVIIPPAPEGRSSGTEAFLNEEFLARVARDLDAT